MKSTLMHIGRAGSVLKSAKRAIQDPLGTLTDWMIRIVAMVFIPVPFAGDVLVKYKKIVLPALFVIALIPIMVIILIFQVIFAPVMAAHGQKKTIITYIGNLLSGGVSNGGTTGSISTTNPLGGYREAGFTSTNIPSRNPFGGSGYSWTTTTATFMDPTYSFFNGIHTGLDLIPNGNYYASSGAYRMTGKPVVMATISGRCLFYIDFFGALVVEIVNQDGTLKTVDMHLAQSFVATGDVIDAGQPIGIMGGTGFTTGPHLHYEVRIRNGLSWQAVNPAGYIH